MELRELVGEHNFSGIENGCIDVQDSYYCDSRSCNFVKFTLDGVHYMAVEDPDDGYRSCCRDLMVSDEAPKNSFAPQKMICSMKGDGEWGEKNDVLVLTDAATGEIIMEIGTEICADYYPCYHFFYYPEGMACNQVPITDEEFEKILFS